MRPFACAEPTSTLSRDALAGAAAGSSVGAADLVHVRGTSGPGPLATSVRLGMVSVLSKFNIVASGPEDAQPMLFAHGFGCDQHMWRLVAPAFADEYRVILFDYIGAGGSDSSAYDSRRYDSLQGYADDVVEIVRELDLRDVVFVGHSVSSMVGAMAQAAEPERFASLVMVGPSPRYIDDGAYRGGFAEADIVEMLGSLESNYLGWSAAMAPAIMNNPDRPELGEELTTSFCRMDPAIARQFARVTFLSDSRADLSAVTVPTLVLQCTDDLIAPRTVGTYVHDAIPGSDLTLLAATGHCPQLSAPDETIRAITDFLRRHDRAAPRA
jgi:sigma-B regulation protein RsbQ